MENREGEAEERGPPPCLSDLLIASNFRRPEGLGVEKPYSLLPTSRKYCNWSLGENQREGTCAILSDFMLEYIAIQEKEVHPSAFIFTKSLQMITKYSNQSRKWKSNVHHSGTAVRRMSHRKSSLFSMVRGVGQPRFLCCPKAPALN